MQVIATIVWVAADADPLPANAANPADLITLMDWAARNLPQGVDKSTFNTMEVRPWTQATAETDKQINFSRAYTNPPGLAVGLNWLDVDKATNIRVVAFADNITKDNFLIHINSWSDTTLNSAGCTWLEVTDGDPDYQIGQFSTEDDHPWNQPQTQTSRQITFPRAFSSAPHVVIWLNKLDMKYDKNWRIKAYSTDISATSFTLHIDTWGDTVLYCGAASWIAYPSNKALVSSGTYNTTDVRAWNDPQANNSGNVRFKDGTFAGPPRALLGLNSLDLACGHNLRLKASADSITNAGMTWHIDSWGDSVLYSAGVSYIALE